MNWRIYLIILLAIIISVTGIWRMRLQKSESAALPIYGAVPNFQLTERSGRSVGLNDLKGKIWVADFMFTSCSDVCPMMTAKMKQLQNSLSSTEGVQLVSFSVDPEKDTPEVLRAYAKSAGASTDRWWFVTGDESKIHQLAMRGFYLGVAAAKDPNPILHSQKFALVDQRGRIRGFFDSDAPNFTEPVLSAIRQLQTTAKVAGG